jgi:hypothetical protein
MIDNGIDKMMQTAGWTQLELKDKVRVYVSDYAAIGIIIENNAKEIINNWAHSQTIISNLRSNMDVGRNKDLYLIFFVPIIDSDYKKQIQEIVNDTFVCRKICIEMGLRTPEESILDIPFLKMILQKDSYNDYEYPSYLEEHGISRNILNDLAKKSVGVILKKIIDGKYNE